MMEMMMPVAATRGGAPSFPSEAPIPAEPSPTLRALVVSGHSPVLAMRRSMPTPEPDTLPPWTECFRGTANRLLPRNCPLPLPLMRLALVTEESQMLALPASFPWVAVALKLLMLVNRPGGSWEPLHLL